MWQHRSFMFARAQTHRLGEAQPEPARERSADVRLALLLAYITIGWMTIEGAASLLLGWASKSLLLEALGIDNAVPNSSVGSRFKEIGDCALLRSGDVRSHP